MYKANVYVRNNNLQRKDTNKVLKNSLKLIKWNGNGDDMILDVGCGSGDVTRDVLLEQFPKFKHILGVDISKEMLTYARKNNPHEKITYMLMDIADRRPLPQDLIERFDHAFSFFVFHWIKDQLQAFSNIFQMLKPGGDVLMQFALTSDVMTIYDKMSHIPRWAKYLRNVRDIFPYQFVEDPGETLEEILNFVGFAHVVKVEQKEYVYDTKEEFKTSMAVINPFLKNIPEEYHDAFMEDFAQLAETMDFYPNHEDFEDVVIVPYKSAVVYLRKPCH